MSCISQIKLCLTPITLFANKVHALFHLPKALADWKDAKRVVDQHLGKVGDTDRYWQNAIDLFKKCNPPRWLDVATIANNLGFLRKSAGQFDSAEDGYLEALSILHEKLKLRDEQTATVFTNLGRLYQTSGFYAQAVEMHAHAVALLEAILDEDHPDLLEVRDYWQSAKANNR